VCRVFGRRIKPAAVSNGTQRDCYDYWITDGLYGSMNCLLYDHATLSARTLRCPTLPPPPPGLEHLQASTVFGPTCDGLDVVLKVRYRVWEQFYHSPCCVLLCQAACRTI